MKCLTELFTLLAVLPLALALNVFQCLDLWRRSNVKHESNDLHKYCMDGFIEGVPANKIDKNVNNYLNSLLRKKIGESFHTVNRVKRQTNRRPLPQGRRRPQAQNTRQPIRQSFQRSVTQSARLQGRFPPDRVRHEVRSPNYDMVWGRFANRTQRLANFSSVRTGMSDYEVLASLHSGEALKSVYGGPAYLAWQRIYLLLFEAAIGVPVPYWDCSLDFHMRDPTRSNIWSPKYFGNGFGELTTGPFKNFRTPSGQIIFRNIGSDGTLFSKQSIEVIMSRSNHSEITEPLEDQRYSLEGHAQGAHVWVDGTFSRINVAAYDPIYFPYHSFVDMLWERFREQMTTLHDKDPAWDYPLKGRAEHRPQNLMKFEPRYRFIPRFRNVQGYSKSVANMISFAPSADCPDCLNSTELYCSQQDICIAREVQENFPVPIPASRQKEANHLSSFARGAIQGANPKELPKDEEDTPARTLAALAAGFRIDPGPKFKCPFKDVRTRGDPISASPNSTPRG